MRNSYETVKIIEESMCENGRLAPGCMMSLFQDTATRHVDFLGFGYSCMDKEGLFWAVTHHCVHFYELPSQGQTVRIRTCCGAASHMIFPRYYRMYSAGGKLLAEAATRWVLVDMNKRSVVMNAASRFSVDGEKNPWKLEESFSVKPFEPDERQFFDPPKEYYDRNGHMNNARYFDAAMKILAPETCGMAPGRAVIEYRSELPEGSGMTVGIKKEACEQAFTKSFYLCGEAALPGREKPAVIFRMKMDFSKSAAESAE